MRMTNPHVSLTLLIAMAMSLASFGADWEQELTPLKPGEFAPLRPVEAHYRFGWEKFVAADAQFKVVALTNQLLEVQGTAQSDGFVRTLWRFDLQHTSWRDAGFRPQGFTQTEIYKRKTVKTRVGFGQSGLIRNNEITPLAESSETKTYPVANACDPFSAYLLMRSQPLRVGDRYRLLVYPGLHLYLAELNVIGAETIKVEQVPRVAIKLSLGLQQVTDQMSLVPYGKFKRATVWLSDDQERIPLKAEADIFVGAVWAELHRAEYSK